MEHLIILIEFLNKNKVKHLDALGNESQLQEFYESLARKSFSSEEAAKAHFFPVGPHQNAYFNRLKRKLRDRLINLLFVVDFQQEQYSNHQTAYYNCYRNLAAIKTMLGRFLRTPAIELSEQTIKMALEYELVEIIFPLARELQFHYSAIEINRKKFTYYEKLVDESLELLSAEVRAEKYYAEVANYIQYRRSLPTELTEKVKGFAEDLRKINHRFQSYRLNLLSFLIFALSAELEDDVPKIILICNQALAFFASKQQQTSLAVRFTFSHKLISALIRIQEFEQAELVARENLHLFDPGTLNHYLIRELYLILCFHTQQFQKAFELFHQVMDTPKFNRYPNHVKEHLRIMEALLYCLSEYGYLKIPEGQNKKFRLSTFLNTVPIFERDKRGTNITILVLQILFLLRKRKFSQIIDRMESLGVYTYRYLRLDHTYRSNCFVKILLQLPRAEFRRKTFEHYAEPFYQKLLAVPIVKAKQGNEVEIIPYEFLYQLVLAVLD